MIEENMALVVVKADSLIKQIPSIGYLRDDLVSAGYVGLVKTINKVARGGVKTARALNRYLGNSISREMLQLLPRERTIHVPLRSNDAARNPETVSWNVQPIDPPVVYNVLPETLQTASHCGLVELRDVFAACCHTERERECLRLREEGYGFVAIGARLNISKTHAQRIFHRLSDAILACWDNP
jgi:DNA-binding NarL/FixJ family response regulator